MGDPQSCAPMDLSSCEQTNAARRESRNALRSLEESGRQLSVSTSRPYEYRTQVPQPQVSQAERSAALSERSSAKIPFRDFAASRWHGSGQYSSARTVNLRPTGWAGGASVSRAESAFGSGLRAARSGNDSIIAPIGFAHRTQMTDWSNVARSAISGGLCDVLKSTYPSRAPAARLAYPPDLDSSEDEEQWLVALPEGRGSVQGRPGFAGQEPSCSCRGSCRVRADLR